MREIDEVLRSESLDGESLHETARRLILERNTARNVLRDLLDRWSPGKADHAAECAGQMGSMWLCDCDLLGLLAKARKAALRP